MKPVYIYSAQLIRVIDGDSFVLNIDLGFDTWVKNHVRLGGIDTPELSRTAPEGHAAKAFTSRWLAIAQGLTLHSLRYNDREKYGRVLGDLYRTGDPVPLSVALRDAGHVKVTPPPPGT